jgi:hypothetical protein
VKISPAAIAARNKSRVFELRSGNGHSLFVVVTEGGTLPKKNQTDPAIHVDSASFRSWYYAGSDGSGDPSR